MATNDGYIKQLELSNLQPTRTYRSRAITAMKMKKTDSKVVRVDLVKPESNKEIILFTHKAYAVRYDLTEIPASGAKSFGVKSVNLKDEDYVVSYIVINPDYLNLIRIGIITQRGAFKQFRAGLVNKVSRAKRGVLVLRELKTKPHRVAAVTSYGQDHTLLITTTSRRHIKISTCDYPLGDRYSNGSFVLDTTSDGHPVNIKLGRPLRAE